MERSMPTQPQKNKVNKIKIKEIWHDNGFATPGFSGNLDTALANYSELSGYKEKFTQGMFNEIILPACAPLKTLDARPTLWFTLQPVMDVINWKLVKIFASGHELRLNDQSLACGHSSPMQPAADNEGRSINVRHSGTFPDSSLGFELP